MIKTLSKYIKGFVKASVATPLFMILEVIMEMLIPLLISSMIDNGIQNPEGPDLGHVVLMGGLMLLCALVALLGGAMGGVFGAKASAGFARNLRTAMFENIQTFSFANIDKFSTAGLVTRMTTDVTNIQNAYQMILRICFRAPVSLIVAMTITLMINAELASIYIIAVVFLGVVMFFLVRKTHKSPAKPNKHSGLSYERMERFMSALPDGVDYLEAYFDLRDKAEAMCASPYAVVSAWFMRQFPKFRTNPLSYLDNAPEIFDFSAVLEKAKKKPSNAVEGEQETA